MPETSKKAKSTTSTKKSNPALGCLLGTILFICIGGFLVIGYFATTSIWTSIQMQKDCLENGNCPEIIIEQSEDGSIIRPNF